MFYAFGEDPRAASGRHLGGIRHNGLEEEQARKAEETKGRKEAAGWEKSRREGAEETKSRNERNERDQTKGWKRGSRSTAGWATRGKSKKAGMLARDAQHSGQHVVSKGTTGWKHKLERSSGLETQAREAKRAGN